MLKRLLVLLALVASAAVLLFPASASSADINCVLPAYGNCYTGYNYWRSHYVYNYGPDQLYCDVHNSSGGRQSYAYINSGGQVTLPGSGYNRIDCFNEGPNQTGVHIIDYL
jgi:hypothetical protein